jgi:F420-dependent oxidoreductase-like protein
MRFGLSTAPQNTTWDAVLSMWELADDMPVFESAWTFDHFYPIFSDPKGPCLEGWITMAALAQATNRIRVGCMVTGMVYRHPAVLANMAATLDIVSHGRLELGVGAAWNEEECNAYGMDRFAEGLEVIHGLLTQEHTTFKGSYYELTEARCEPKPVQHPHPPIVIGGRGEKRTLPLVAKWADHWNAGAPDPAELRHKLEVLHGYCAEEGRDPADITVSVLVQTSDPAAVGDQAGLLTEAGADVILCRPARYEPALLEQLASALDDVRS